MYVKQKKKKKSHYGELHKFLNEKSLVNHGGQNIQ